MNLLRTTGKLQRTPGSKIFSFGLPPVKTCPGASTCIQGCYARQGRYTMEPVKRVRRANLRISRSSAFVDLINYEIKARGVRRVRIHDSGDFYCVKYVKKWYAIARANPETWFYCYTKSIPMIMEADRDEKRPDNIHIVFSHGGKFDGMIGEHHAQSKVFWSKEALERNGYMDGTDDDRVAMFHTRVGLVYHGARKYRFST